MWQLTIYVLPLNAARRDATANLKCFWGLGQQRPNSMVTFTFTMRRHLIRFASHKRHLSPPVRQRLVGFGFRVQRVRRTTRNLRRVGENSDTILSRLWTKVREIFRGCRKRLYFPTPFSDCLCHVLFEVVEKPRKCKSLLAPIYVGGTAPTFLRQFVRAPYYLLLGKVWLSSVY